MGMAGRHDDRFARVENIFNTVDGDLSDAVQTENHCIAAGFVGADFFVLIKSKEGDADRVILNERFADDLSGLISNLIFE